MLCGSLWIQTYLSNIPLWIHCSPPPAPTSMEFPVLFNCVVVFSFLQPSQNFVCTLYFCFRPSPFMWSAVITHACAEYNYCTFMGDISILYILEETRELPSPGEIKDMLHKLMPFVVWSTRREIFAIAKEYTWLSSSKTIHESEATEAKFLPSHNVHSWQYSLSSLCWV